MKRWFPAPLLLALSLALSLAWPASAADWLCRGASKVKGGEMVVELRIDPQKRLVSAAASLTLGEAKAIPRADLSLWMDLVPRPNGLLARTRSLAVVIVVPAQPPPAARSVLLTVTVEGRGLSKPWGRYREIVGNAAAAPPPEPGARLLGLSGRIPFDEAFSGDPLDGEVKGPIDIRAVGDDGLVLAEARVEMPPPRALWAAMMRAYGIALQDARNPAKRCETMAA